MSSTGKTFNNDPFESGKEQTIKRNDNDFNREMNNACTLKEIRDELIKLNQYMQIITNEEL